MDTQFFGVSSTIWSPALLNFSPQYLYDLAVAASVTKDGSNNVTALADARANYQSGSSPAGRTMLGSGGGTVGGALVAPVYHADVSVDGTPGLLFTHASATHMRADTTGAVPGNAPFCQFSVATVPSQTFADFSAVTWFGTNNVGGGGVPGNGGIAIDSDAAIFVGGFGTTNFTRGYAGTIGRDQSQPTTAASRLVLFDGTTLRAWTSGIQQLEWVGATYGLTTDDLHLGGTYGGLGTCVTAYQHYGFFQTSQQGTLSLAEAYLLLGWVKSRFPSMKLAPRLVGHGCSIEAGRVSGASPEINGSYITLAAAAARAAWTNINNALTGRGIGLVSNANGTALYGDGSQTVAAPDRQTAFPWKTLWQATPQASTNLVSVGLEATNDMYFGATAVQAFEYQRAICSLVAARGGTNLVATITPRSDAGVAGTFAAQRLLFNAMVLSLWNKPLSAGGLGAKYLLDPTGDARLQDETNTTYFNGDKVHPLVAGQAVLAGTSATGAAGCPAYGPGGLLGNVGLLGILNAEAPS